jgi:drug/metabolite transporter (DMT)-like permease
MQPAVTAAASVRRRAGAGVYGILFAFLASKAIGNLGIAVGAKRFPQTLGLDPLAYLRAMADPVLAGGIILLILALLVRMALLSRADLSFVLPVTAVGYVFATVLGKFVLGEHVSGARWVGTLLIVAGAALVGSDHHRTPGELVP